MFLLQQEVGDNAKYISTIHYISIAKLTLSLDFVIQALLLLMDFKSNITYKYVEIKIDNSFIFNCKISLMAQTKNESKVDNCIHNGIVHNWIASHKAE